MAEPDPIAPSRRRCRATSKSTGKQCGQSPVPGAAVCRMHGGGAPQVKRKAMLRLAALVDPAILTIARVMTDQTASPGDRLKAANSVLDRAGIARQTEQIDLETAQAYLVERLIEAREALGLPDVEVPDYIPGAGVGL